MPVQLVTLRFFRHLAECQKNAFLKCKHDLVPSNAYQLQRESALTEMYRRFKVGRDHVSPKNPKLSDAFEIVKIVLGLPD